MTRDLALKKFFYIFLPLSLVIQIVRPTNMYQIFNLEGRVKTPHSRIFDWSSITVGEMYFFLAVVILMGIIKKPNMKKCWSQVPLLSTPIFGKIIS